MAGCPAHNRATGQQGHGKRADELVSCSNGRKVTLAVICRMMAWISDVIWLSDFSGKGALQHAAGAQRAPRRSSAMQVIGCGSAYSNKDQKAQSMSKAFRSS